MAANKKDPITVYVEGRMVNGSLFEKDVYTDARGREATSSYKIELSCTEEQIAELEELVVNAAIDEWGDSAEKAYDDGHIRSPITDGNDIAAKRKEKGKAADAYEGMWVVRASTIFNKHGEDAPGSIYVCDENAEEIGFAEREKIYNGCYVSANFTVSPYDVDGRGVKLYLNGVQFVKDGERLRGKDPSSLFNPLGASASSEGEGRRRRG